MPMKPTKPMMFNRSSIHTDMLDLSGRKTLGVDLRSAREGTSLPAATIAHCPR
jgi:hypothetical protein